MKIQFMSENFPPESNAAATRVYERACYWVKWGHQVTVITSAPNFPEGKLFPGYQNKWKQSETMSGIRVVRVKTYIAANQGIIHRTFDFLSFMVVGFFAALKEERPDVITATSPQFFTAVAGWAASAVRGIPFVFELGDLWPASITAVGSSTADANISPHQRFSLVPPRVMDLATFGCRAVVLKPPTHQHKPSPRAEAGRAPSSGARATPRARTTSSSTSRSSRRRASW